MSVKPLHTRVAKSLKMSVKRQALEEEISLADAVAQALHLYFAGKNTASKVESSAGERVQLFARIPEELHFLVTRHCAQAELGLEGVLTAALTAWLKGKMG